MTPQRCQDVFWRSSRGSPENVLATSRISLPGTFLERQIRMSPGHHFKTSPGRQIWTFMECSNSISRVRPGDVGGGRPRDVLGTNICRLGSRSKFLVPFHPLTNLEIRKYYQNEPKFIGFYSRNNWSKIKYGAYIINLDEYESIGTHWIALYINAENVTQFNR